MLALEVGGSSRRCRSEPRVQLLAGGEFVLVSDKTWHTQRTGRARSPPPQAPGQGRNRLLLGTLSLSGDYCEQETSLADPKHRNPAKISPSGSGRGRIWEDIGLRDIIGITFTAQPTLSLGDVLEQISWHFVAYLTGK